MSNDRLHLALSKAGLTPEGLAELAAVDLRTAQRWLAGRTPHWRHRITIAKALQLEEAELWPEAAPRVKTQGSSNELEGAWATATEPGAPRWQKLITNANERIELCDYTLLDILEAPGATTLLANKAAAGTTVKLMIASLDSLWLTLDDWPPDTRRALAGEGPLTQGIRQSHKRLWQLTNNSQAEALQVLMPRCPSILRFDNDMLIAIALWGDPRPRAPILHLHRRQQNGIFDKFTTHYQALWQTGRTINQNPDEPPPNPAANPGQHSDQPQNQRRPTFTPYGRRQPHRPRG